MCNLFEFLWRSESLNVPACVPISLKKLLTFVSAYSALTNASLKCNRPTVSLRLKTFIAIFVIWRGCALDLNFYWSTWNAMEAASSQFNGSFLYIFEAYDVNFILQYFRIISKNNIQSWLYNMLHNFRACTDVWCLLQEVLHIFSPTE